jgi:hypothetical protein
VLLVESCTNTATSSTLLDIGTTLVDELREIVGHSRTMSVTHSMAAALEVIRTRFVYRVPCEAGFTLRTKE